MPEIEYYQMDSFGEAYKIQSNQKRQFSNNLVIMEIQVLRKRTIHLKIV